MRKLALIVCLLSASLFGDAAIVVPDTMLTINHAYYTSSSDTSLAIIQTMRQRQMAPTWQLDMTEADYCYATMDYTKALQLYQSVYNSGEAKGNAELYMALLARLMQSHDILYNEDELVTFIYELKETAQRYKNDAYLAMADFIIGKRKHYHRKKQEGLDLCIQAVETMKGSDYFRKDNELCNYYAELLQMYMDDGRYDDALRMSLLQEEAVLRIKGVSAKNKESLRFVYALRASLLARAGRNEEADVAYDKWKKQPDGNCIVDKRILDYLIINKHYQEAQQLIHEYHDMLKSQKDNYSYRMITLLTTAAQVEGALGNHNEAAKHCQEIKTIADSLHIGKSYSLMNTKWNLIQTKKDVGKKNIILNVLGIILIIGLMMGAIILYYTRRLRHRNERLIKALNGLDAYRNRAISQSAGPISPINPEPISPIGPISSIDPMSPTSPTSSSTDTDQLSEAEENERLFVELDGQITRNRLFLKPNFGRDDMARLIGVNKNRIGRIMSHYSSASNASVYINTKRIEYGAKLLLKYPDYTIAAIATECGMSNTVTFNRTFKEVYGMTPTEYREKSKKSN